MSNKIIDFTTIKLKEALNQVGLTLELTEKIIIDYIRYYKASELDEACLLRADELNKIDLIKDKLLLTKVSIKDGKEFFDNNIFSYLSYIGYKSQISATYHKTKDWTIVFYTDVYSDVSEINESFIDYIEQTYQTKIKEIKQLQELTGIYKLNSWDKKLKKYKQVGDKEAKENAIIELDKTLTRARYDRFSRAVSKALDEGAKYKDLLHIEPKDYGLPERWEYCLTSDQYTTILFAISLDYGLLDPDFMQCTPKPRDIAKDLEAPLSVIMDAINCI
jgi:hypothetical protein